MNNSFADFYSIIGYCWCIYIVSKHFFMYAVTKTRVLNPTLTQPSTKTIIIYIVKGWKLRRKPPKIPLKSRQVVHLERLLEYISAVARARV